MLQKWFLYFKSRFPIIPLIVFTGLFAISFEIYYSIFFGIKFLIPSLLLLVYFLLLRLLDELKDYEFDSIFHKDRPVQQGVISLKEIKTAVLFTITTLIILSVRLNEIYLTGLIAIYTYLMYKEFYIPKFSDKYPILYLISHEAVFILWGLLFVTYFKGTEKYLVQLADTLIIAYFVITVSLIEIGRKMKHRIDIHGNITKDTYIFAWGEKNTIAVFFILSSYNFLIYSHLKQTDLGYIYALFCILIVLGLKFSSLKKLIMKSNMILTIIFALLFPILLIL